MVRYVPLVQLWSRLALTLRRQLAVRFPDFFGHRLTGQSKLGLRVKAWIAPIMPARQGILDWGASGDLRFRYLNETRTLTLPIHWSLSGTGSRALLWRQQFQYMEFLESVTDAQFEVLVSDWLDQNPPFGPQYWLEGWNAFVLSIRAVIWMQQLAIRPVSAALCARMTASLIDQLRFLTRNLELDIRGNHIMKNIKALLWAGTVFEGEEAQAWQCAGMRLLDQELSVQILDDGMQFELSPMYHLQVFVDVMDAEQVLPEGPLKTRTQSLLKKMAQVVADLSRPDGGVVDFGDTGMITYPASMCLAVYRQHYGDVGSRLSAGFSFWDAGYFGYRSEAMYLCVDGGRIGPDELPAHGHGDIFSFEWCVDGERVVVDPGVFEYNAGPKRDYGRSTAAHNTLTLEGEDQAEFFGSFRLGYRPPPPKICFFSTPNGMRFLGWHEGYLRLAGEPRHRREFALEGRCLMIRDFVVHGAGQVVQARLLLAASCTVTLLNANTVEIQTPKGRIQGVSSGTISVETGAWSPEFGVEVSAPRLVITYGKAPCSGMLSLSS